MNDYQKTQLKRLRKAQRDLRRIAGDLSDIYGTDNICALCRHVAGLTAEAEMQFRIELED
jgi:cell division protein FtsB